MDVGTILQLAGTIGGIVSPILFAIFRSSAQKYTDRKAENLATLQDIGKITDQVERIKSDYQMWFQASRFVYENEYTLLKEVWKESWELQAKARSLTPIIDRGSPDETERQRERIDRYNTYVKQVDCFKASVIKNKPFIAAEVYSSCDKIWKIVVSLQVIFEMSIQHAIEPDWEKVMTNGEELDAELEVLCQAIRRCVFDRPSWLEGKLTLPST